MSDLQKLLASLSPEKRKLLELQLKKKGSAFNTFPLSYAQRRLWFLEQLLPGNTAYNIPAAVRLKGRLNIPAVEKGLQAVIRRHEVLRTTFTTVNGNPMQVIHRHLEIPLQLVDLSAVNGDDQEARLQQEMRRIAGMPFALEKGPLMRITLFRLNPEEHVLFVVMHHIISDGWSVGVFIREFSEWYTAALHHRDPRLPDLPIQYVDFAQWQRKWLRGEQRRRQLDYWKQVLGDDLPVLELPTDFPRPPVRRYRGGCVEAVFPAELVKRLHRFSNDHQSTLFMTLLAAFYVLLFRYTGQEDITVGTPIANRNREETENLIGFFVNTLVLRARFSGLWTFEQVLETVRRNALGAFAHQDLPFEMLVEELSPPRDTSHTPLFQVMFVHQNLPSREFRLPGLTLSPVKLDTGAAKFDLTLTVGENARGQLLVNLEYDVDLFRRETVQRMIQHYRNLLQAILEHPRRPVHQLSLLSKTEAAGLQAALQSYDLTREVSLLNPGYKASQRMPPFTQPLPDLIEEQVRRTPQAVALVFGDQKISYEELNRRANRLAHYLMALGVRPDTLVGVNLPRSPELIIALLGILKAGGAYVPIDPEYPPERKAFIMADARLSLVLTQSRCKAEWPRQPAQTIYLDGIDEQLQSCPESHPEISLAPEHLAYMIYTSGSTGKPKGTMITHRGLTHYLNWAVRAYPLDRGRGSLVHSPIAFDATITAVFPALLRGRALYLVPEGQELEQLAAMLRQEGDFSLVKITPAHLELLAQQIPPEQAAGSAHALVIGGDNLTYEKVAFWQTHAPQTLLYNEYGPTETVVGCVVYRIPEGESGAGSVPIGRAIPGIRLYVLDQYLQKVPVGVPGELFIAGEGVARGYWERPDLTAEKFLPDPFADQPGARMYRTGDRVKIRPDGQLEFLGRLDNQVKVRGYRIELGEIEAVLRTHPGVQDVVVLLREDVPGDPRLVAYVVAREGHTINREALREHLNRELPEYMIPATFVCLEAFPLTPNGKIDRRALPIPDYAAAVSEAEYVAPRTPIEEIVARQMAAVLHLDRVGVRDNFFDLGGHSLLATQLVSRINDAFDIQLPLTAVFEQPTVEGLARRIGQLQLEEKGLRRLPIEPVSRMEDLPLSFSQQRLWFLDQMEPGNPFYNIPAAFRLKGPLQPEVFQQAVQEVVRRHEILRTKIETVDGKPRQVVLETLSVDMPVETHSNLLETERTALIEKEGFAMARQGFRLDQPPLFRLKILRFAPDDHAVLISMHHIISDGWSMGILVREIAGHYQAFREGLPSPLPPLPIQYADYAAWQRRWMDSEAFQTQLRYWKEKLADSPPVLELPTDRPRPPIPSFKGSVYAFRIDAELTRKLLRLCQETDTTLFMCLLAAFATLLYRYSRQTDINIGTPIANRNRLEIEPLIGFFVNTLVLRTDLSGGVSFRELLERVRQTALEAYAHQDVPFEKIVDVLNIPRDVSHSPLFQVMFSLNNIRARKQQFSDLQVTPIILHSGTAKFDLTLEVNEQEDGLSALVEYNTDLFDRETIEQMMVHYVRLLEGVVRDPDVGVSRLELLTSLDRERLLACWDGGSRDYGGGLFVERFESSVRDHGDMLAVVSGEVRLSYRELNERANRLARYLRGLGVSREDLVGLYLERGVEMVVALLGVLKAGGAYVPIEVGYPRERVRYMLEDSGVKVLLTCGGLLEGLGAVDVMVVCLDDAEGLIERESGTDLGLRLLADQLAYVIYTSGSTGRPKGTLVTHGGLMNYVNWALEAYPYGCGVGVVVHSPLGFDATVTSLYPPLLVGGWLRMVGEGGALEELSGLLRREGGYGVVKITPAHLEALGQMLSGEMVSGMVEGFVIGGERLLWSHVSSWRVGIPGVRLYNEYGPTETVVGCVVYEVPEGYGGGGDIPIGRPIPNVRVYVLDEEMFPVPVGVVGELYIGGVGVSRGYLGRPDLTAERFLPDVYGGSGERMYRTGDLVRYRRDGLLEFVGRVDDQVKVRGYRVEPGEVESVLLEHSGITDAVVVVRGGRLVAYYVGEALGVGPLRRYLSARLPEYMVPSQYVRLASLPLTVHGKVDVARLPEPDLDREALGERYVGARNEVERLLVEIWQEVLGLETVGVRDNFFELGGDSILSIQVIARANQAGIRITPVQMFQYQTIEQLASVAEKARPILAEQGLVTGEVPLTPIQHWFFELNLPNPHHWNQSVFIEIDRRLNPEVFSRALKHLVEHHDALRMRFSWKDREPRQINLPPEEKLPFHYFDVSRMNPERVSQWIAEKTHVLQAGLHLENGPMFGVAYFYAGGDRPGRLFFTAHHLIMDGVSWRILLEDLFTVYQQLESGGEPQLPPKTTAFKQWAERLQALAVSDELAREADFWRSLPVEKIAPLPRDFPDGRNSEAAVSYQRLALSEEETGSLLQEVTEKLRAYINEVLLVALAGTLNRWTGRRAFLIDMEGHGREHLFDDVDLSRTVGWFTSLFPVVVDLKNAVTVEEMVKVVKDQFRQIPRGGVGFGLLKYLAPEAVRRELAEFPRAEISFNYLGQLDQAIPENAPIRPAPGPQAPDRAAENPRTHLITITGGVQQGRLEFSIGYSSRLFREETMQQLGNSFREELLRLIEAARKPTTDALSTSDFPLADLDEDKLTRVLGKLKGDD